MDNKQINLIRWVIALSILAIASSIALWISFAITDLNSIDYLNGKDMEDAIIKSKIEALHNRFTDLYIWIGFFITLLAGLLFLNWFSTHNIAKREANKEFEEVYREYKKHFEEIKKMKDEILEMKDDIEDTKNELVMATREARKLNKKE